MKRYLVAIHSTTAEVTVNGVLHKTHADVIIYYDEGSFSALLLKMEPGETIPSCVGTLTSEIGVSDLERRIHYWFKQTLLHTVNEAVEVTTS